MSRTGGVLRPGGERAVTGTNSGHEESEMRYLLIVNFEGGVVEAPMEEWKPE